MTTFNTNAINTSALPIKLTPEKITDIFNGKENEIEIINYDDKDPLAALLNWLDNDSTDSAVDIVRNGERLLQYNKQKSLARHFVYDQKYYDLASEIRHYYQQKLVMKSLRGEELTSYQKKLSRVLTSRTELDADGVGVMIRLPDFYREDRIMDQMLEGKKSMPTSKNQKYNPNTVWSLVNNEAVVSLSRKRHQRRYFLTNDQNQVVMLYSNANQVDGNSAVLDLLMEKFNQFTFTGPLTVHHLPGRYFQAGAITNKNSIQVAE